jgi:DNA-binding NarL/FixJ family response regulator
MIGAGHSVCPDGLWDDRRHASNRAHRRRPCRLPSLRPGVAQAEGFDVIGEATDGAEAVEAVSVLRPEIVLLDIQLPDLDGLTVAEQLG